MDVSKKRVMECGTSCIPKKRPRFNKFHCLRSYTQWLKLPVAIFASRIIQIWWKRVRRNKMVNTVDYITMCDLEQPIFRHVSNHGAVTGFSANMLAEYIQVSCNLKHPMNGEVFNVVEIRRLDKITNNKFNLRRRMNSFSRKRKQIIDESTEYNIQQELVIEHVMNGLKLCENQVFYTSMNGCLQRFQMEISYHIDWLYRELDDIEGENTEQHIKELSKKCANILSDSKTAAYNRDLIRIFGREVKAILDLFVSELQE
jgi:hypothetical protein